MIKNKKFAILFVLLIFLVGCTNNVPATEQVNIEDMIEEEKVEIAGNSYDLLFGSTTKLKYDEKGRLLEQLSIGMKIVYFYDKDLVSKMEKYSYDRLIATHIYTYDNKGKEIKREIITEKTKDKSYWATSYGEGYKEVSYYNTEGELSRVTRYELNENQQAVKSIFQSDNGEHKIYHKYEDGQRIFTRNTQTGSMNFTREIFYRYNKYGDIISQTTVSFGDINTLRAIYYNNEYDESKLIKTTVYSVHENIDEETAKDIIKSLK